MGILNLAVIAAGLFLPYVLLLAADDLSIYLP
jgi:hypothetical protein